MVGRLVAVLVTTTLLPGVAACGGSAGSASATRTVAVTVSGGFVLGADDYGRPVPLYASMLGVTPAVFRQAFAGVRPDTAHDPSAAQQQTNKGALMSVLAAYDVTNARLDEVANYYRFDGTRGQTWPHRAARVEAVVSGGRVVSVRILDAGAGCTQSPTLTVPGYPATTLTATVEFTRSFATNGQVAAVAIA
jgi:hypothetical protein